MKTSPSWIPLNGLCGKATSPLGLAAILLSAALACSLPAVQAAGTWDGGGGDNNFATAANWVGDVAPGTPYAGIVMSGNTNTSPTFTANATFNGAGGIPGLLFNATTTGAFNFSGSDLTISGGTTNPAISNLNSGFTQTITNNMTIANGGAAVSANGTGSNLTFNGTIGLGASAASYALLSNSLAGSIITFNGALSGNGTLTIGQSSVSGGTTVLNGANTFTTSANLVNGTVIVSSNTALGTASANMGAGSGVNNVSLLTSSPITIANNITLKSGPTNTFTIGTNTTGNTTFSGVINMGNDTSGNGFRYIGQAVTLMAAVGGTVNFTNFITPGALAFPVYGGGDNVTVDGGGSSCSLT